ncbi:ADP-ribosyltransferase, partial [Kitasatospora sp. NPDC093679]|uniref:ADP-ribosyltransferase n=1 Tax=Kitasatospora sp. NPDC093679 TaxID=3154983 RepID=UPI003437F213
TGGGSEAGVVAERAAIAAAEKAAAKSAAQNAAVHTGESAAEQAAAQAAKNTAVESGEQAGRSAASSAAVPHTTPSTGPGGLPEGWTLQPAEARPGTGVHEPGTGVHEPPTVGETPHGQAPATEPAVVHAPEEAPSPHTPDGDPAAPGEEHPAESAAHSDTPGPDAEGGSGHADAADGGPGTADHEQGPPPAAAGPGADQAIRLDPHAALREMRDLEDMRAAQSEISQNARTFRDDYDIVEFGRTWNDDIAKLPESQREALQAYTYGSDQEINGALRGQHPATPECAAKVRELDRALAAHPVPEDVVVSRGTDLGHFRMSPEEMEGRTFTEQGYMSTSPGTDPPAAFRAKEAILHLRVPSGTPGAWVEEAGQMGSAERELLLGRGQRWRADRVIRTADGKIHIYGEVL